ncbi:MAG: hypothetical protein QMD86_00015 [Patescibacteria group bacterium]|nr:hypothetical protein [Patescibacteria group bacterium]
MNQSFDQAQDKVEFIKNRSFEIAWAVFRCAALLKQEKLKREMENASVELTLQYGNLETGDGVPKTSVISRLMTLIRLADVAGIMNSVNASVLYRELKNFSDVLDKLGDNIQKDKQDIDFEDIFTGEQNITSKIPIKIENKSKFIEQPIIGQDQGGLAIRQPNYLVKLAVAKADNSADLLQNNSVKVLPDGLEKFSIRQAIKPVAERISRSSYNSAIMPQKSSAIAESHNLGQKKYWYDLILNKMKEINRASTRDLAVFFPQVSERTLRLHLQRLCESGQLERVGKGTGPGVYYRVNQRQKHITYNR